jgi:hypothetical protein
VASWRDHYYSIAPAFFGLKIVFGLSMMSLFWVIEGNAPPGPAIAISSVPVLASVACSVTRKPWVHGVVLAPIVGINLLSIFSFAFSPMELGKVPDHEEESVMIWSPR